MNHLSSHHDSDLSIVVTHAAATKADAEPTVCNHTNLNVLKVNMNTNRNLQIAHSPAFLPICNIKGSLKFALAVLSFSCAQAFAAGVVSFVSGSATVINAAGESQQISKKMRINAGDTIITGKNGEVQMVTDDHGLVAMRANSRLQIDDYAANGDEQDRASYTLLKGFMRSVTGWIGKVAPRNYSIRAANATIGIRGTDHELGLVEGNENAAYSKVNEGETTLGNAAGEVVVKAGRAAFVDFSKPAAPRLLEGIPAFFKPSPNEKNIDATKKKLAAELDEKLKQRRNDIKRDGGTNEKGNTRINEACSGSDLATNELLEFVRAYEAGNIAAIQAKIDPSMLGYQRFIDGLIQDFNRQKQIRMLVKDIQVQCGADLATVQFNWEKRYLDVITFAPALLVGRGTLLMHRSLGNWKVAAIAGDNPFSGFAGTKGQLTFGPAFSLAAVSVIPTNVPITVQVIDSDMAGIGSLTVQIVTNQGDAESITLPEISPGRFARNFLAVAAGAPVQGNGILELANGVQLTLRYVDQKPGNNLPPTMLTQTLKTTGSILFVPDTTPDAFSFASMSNVAASAKIVSSTQSINGINAPTSITISGGEYAIGAANFTTVGGTITNGQQIRLRVTASPISGGVATATVNVGGVVATFTVTTDLTTPNATPAPFSFSPRTNAPVSTLITTQPAATITGINVPAQVSIVGGDFSIGGGAFVTTGLIANNQTLAVRLLSSAAFSSTTLATVTVGGVAATFAVTTTAAAINSVPDPFVFTPISNVATNQSFKSNTITVSGINAPSPISIIGGSYSFGGSSGQFTTAPGIVSNGQTVTVQLQSSSANLTTTSATVNIGGVSGTFSVTTAPVAGNSTPNPFSFAPQTNVPQSTLIVASPVATITGINIASPVSIVGGDFSIAGSGQFVTTGFISNNQTLAVRVLSAATAGATTSATVNVGGVAATFSVTTTAFIPNAVPNPFSFAPQSNVAQATLISPVLPATITGINVASPVTIVGGLFSIAGGGFTNTGSITNGQSLNVQVLSSAAFGTSSSATVTVGGVAATFTVTTLLADTTPNPFSFTPQTNVGPSILVTSNTVSITGINTNTPVSIVGGTYSINGGAFTGAAGSILNNQTIAVQATSSGLTNGSGIATVTLNIGGVMGTFTVTTYDDVPNVFSFPTLVTTIAGPPNCVISTSQYSTAAVLITGLTTSTSISLSPATATMSINGGPFISGPSSIANNQTVVARVNTVGTTTGATPNTRATVNIGGVTANVTQTCN